MKRLKYKSVETPAKDVPTPKRVILLMEQQGVSACEPTVAVGDEVKAGQVVGAVEDGTFASVHTPIAGKVTELTVRPAADGHPVRAVVVEGSGETTEAFESAGDYLSLSAEEILKRLRQAGVTTLGYTRDTAFSPLGGMAGRALDTVIISGLDDEPLISVNQFSLKQGRDDIQIGIEILKKITGASKILVAAPAELTGRIPDTTAVEGAFPGGLPQMLLWKLTGRTPTGSEITPDDKAAVIRAETVVSMVRALRDGRPVIDKLVTVVGGHEGTAVNMRAPLGTPMKDVLKAAGLTAADGDRVVMGGPMRGVAQFDLDAPITKRVDGVILQKGSDVTEFTDAPCIGCGGCIPVCPVKIQVNMLTRFCEFGQIENALAYDLRACIECGLCAYVCTARRPLLQFIQFAKAEQAKIESEKSSIEESATT